MVKWDQGFSTSALLAFGGWVILCPVYCGLSLAESLPSAHSLTAPPPPVYDNEKCLQRLPHVPWEGAGKHHPIVKQQTRQIWVQILSLQLLWLWESSALSLQLCFLMQRMEIVIPIS